MAYVVADFIFAVMMRQKENSECSKDEISLSGVQV